MRFSRLVHITLGLLLIFAVTISIQAQDRKALKSRAGSIEGRWDLTVHGSEGDYPAWLEVKRSGPRTLVGSFVGQFGSARPISQVFFENGELHFTIPPQFETRRDNLTFKGK